MRITKKLLQAIGIALLVICGLLLFVSILLFYSAQWYHDVYGELGFDSILYTLFANLNGVQSGLVSSYLEAVLPHTLLVSAFALTLVFFRSKRKIVATVLGRLRIRLYPLNRVLAGVLCVLLSGVLLYRAAVTAQLDEYIEDLTTQSHIFEEEYRDPKTTTITFPEEKRNLIYIFLESMETTYLSHEQGGALNQCVIPELYDLAQRNINFSHNQDVGGFSSVSGTTWTIGAMVGQTAGIPLKTPPGVDGNGYGTDGDFLPGVTTITDILHENGYYQALMVGSDSSFGGRKQYFTQHGMDAIYDLHTARADDVVAEDYYVWWGFEDKHLFSYAQQELTALSQMDQPFAFTMLTVDTHHVGGYLCEYCENTYEEQYENAMACSSRQVSAFVEWLQQQDFYENTTIVIVGDHCTMDNGYIQRAVTQPYSRHVYNCIINSAAQPVSTHDRLFCALDMFPTTLAAIGCQIEGDRLGLGTNLFSQVPTLLEETSGAFYHELGKRSNYYIENFFFSK